MYNTLQYLSSESEAFLIYYLSIEKTNWEFKPAYLSIYLHLLIT